MTNIILACQTAHLYRHLPGAGSVIDERQTVTVKVDHFESLVR